VRNQRVLNKLIEIWNCKQMSPDYSSPDFVNHPLLKKDVVQRRDYQEKIFASCVGKNSMVVLPTSLGKTIVALMLTLYHLSNDPDAKIIFLAPTKPLVVQHQKSFLDLTVLKEWQLPVMTGSIDPEKRKKIFLDAKVAFMTPQVLQNDVISNRIELDQISLIIFDEAHRATGDYAYTFLAEIYSNKNPKGQILAMSASPGGDRQKIEEVCKALKVEHIEIRSSQSSDVKPYVHNVGVNWITIEMPKEYMQLKKNLEGLLKTLHKKLHENNLLDDLKPEYISRKQILSCSAKIDYEIKHPDSEERLTILFASKKLVSNAIRISHMLELLEGQGIEPLHDYYNKNITEVRSPQASKSLKELFMMDIIRDAVQITKGLVESNFIHPKLIKVSELLLKQFQENPESRVLMFASFRDSISSILRHLSDFPLIKAQAFVGQQKKKSGDSSVNGMSQKEQIQMLQDFREGTYNTLVATSVAEEGLDIAECDLVIFYDVIPSEIRTIQRRGRTGRKKDGEIYLLMTKGTREEAYYWAERRREKEMQKTLKEFKQIKIVEPKTSISDSETNSSSDNGDSKIDSASDKNTGTLFDYIHDEKEENTEQIDESANDSEAKDDEFSEDDQIEENYESLDEDRDTKIDADADNPITDKIENIPGSLTAEEKFVTAEEFGGKSKGLTVVVDNRETQSSVVRHLALGGADIILKNLPVGDYILSDQIGIERKEAMDFNKSIIDGRVFDELHNLCQNFTIPILILEGNPVGVSGISHEAILGAISSIVINMRITVLSTQDAKETADYILAMTKKAQIQKDSSDKVYKRKTNTLSEAQEQVVSGIPGINLYRAQELLSAMSNLKSIFNADEAELKKIPGIGYKTAEKIKQIAEWDYNQKEKETTKKELDTKKVNK
jgi:ERCC4-related helicase/ERCC4-type nuclease